MREPATAARPALIAPRGLQALTRASDRDQYQRATPGRLAVLTLRSAKRPRPAAPPPGAPGRVSSDATFVLVNFFLFSSLLIVLRPRDHALLSIKRCVASLGGIIPLMKPEMTHTNVWREHVWSARPPMAGEQPQVGAAGARYDGRHAGARPCLVSERVSERPHNFRMRGVPSPLRACGDPKWPGGAPACGGSLAHLAFPAGVLTIQ